MGFIVEVFLAYLLADLATGIYHLATDNGWNVKSQVVLFQSHHDDPDMDFDLKPLVIGLPLMLLALFGFHPVFFLVFGLSIGLCQVPHYYAHHPGGRLVSHLQHCRLLLSPGTHARHHNSTNENYCTLSGWNNGWFNLVVARRHNPSVT